MRYRNRLMPIQHQGDAGKKAQLSVSDQKYERVAQGHLPSASISNGML